jgi:restriction system protein
MMLPLLTIAAQGPLTRAEAAEQVADLMGLTPEQRSVMIPSGDKTMVRSRVGWARTYLIQAELLRATRRGVFEITDLGRQVLAEKPASIDSKFLRRFPPFLDFIERSRKSQGSRAAEAASEEASTDWDQTPTDRLARVVAELNSTLRETLLERILAASPEFFEKLVIQLLVKMGYGGSLEEAAQHIGGPGDGGVDGVIKLDPLGLDRVYIQAKRYEPKSKVGRPDIQSFAGALDTQGTTRGVFVTTSAFTADAIACAAGIRTKQIVLIDGDQLADLLITHDVAVREKQRVLIKDVDEDFFEE